MPKLLVLAAGLIGPMLAGLMLAGPAAAGQVIYSYDSVTPITQQMTENGVTFFLDKSFMHVRVLKMVETQDVGAAELRPASESDLGRGGLAALIGRDGHERDLDEITSKEDGRALINALCQGADRGWLAFGPIHPGQDLRVRALGRDRASGRTWLCVTLDYAFHGEWTAPPVDLPQPDRTDRFNDAPAIHRF